MTEPSPFVAPTPVDFAPAAAVPTPGAAGIPTQGIPTQGLPTPVQFSLNPSDDSSSQFYLHPSDNPGSKIVFETLDGSNYVYWSRSVLMALAVKNKAGFVTGSVLVPEETSSPLFVAWYRANSLVLSWILNSVNPDIRSSLLYFTTAQEVWDELRVRYAKSDGPRIFHLEKTLSSLSQGTLSISQFYINFKAVWDEYVNYRSIPKCSCGYLNRCSCLILQSISDRQQLDSVLKFLVGLNETYSSVRSQILLMSPMPPLNKVYSLLLQEESQRMLSVTSTSSTTNSVQFESAACIAKQNQNRERNRPSCAHCHFPGHTIDKCFQLIGYPPTTSSGPVFSFTSSSGSALSSPSLPNTQPLFGNPPFGCSFTASPGNNDQMNAEDSMAEGPAPSSALAPIFGQTSVAPSPPGFGFGSTPPSQVNPFIFGGQPNQVAPQNPSPFQPSGSLEFNAGGSFSLGSTGAGDKSGRKIVQINRIMSRKK